MNKGTKCEYIVKKTIMRVIKVITVIEGTKVDPEVMTEDIGIDRLMIEDTEIDHQVMIEDIRADQGAREGLEEMNLMSTNVIEKDQETEGMTTGQEDIDTQGQEKDIKNFVC